MGYGRPPVDVKALGERLRKLRGKRSAEAVVRSLQAKQGFMLTGHHLYIMEKGGTQNPGFKTLDALAKEYGTTVEFLVYGIKERITSAR
jgi:transcriptional regulator with XRE-family HTH domain